MRIATWGDRIVAAYAWVLVALRLFVSVAWVAAAVLAWLWLPPLGGSGQSPLGDIVPERSAALDTQDRALRLFGSTVLTDTLVVQRNPRGLERAEVEGLVRGAAAVAARRQPRDLAGVRGAVPIVNAPVQGIRWRERDTTAVTYLFLAPDLNLVERDAAARRFIDRYARAAPGTSLGVTGAGPARLAQYNEIEDVLPWVEAATMAVIVLVVAVYFRSLGAPLVTLFTAAVAYVVAVRVLAWAGERADVTVPREIEPILVVLLLGLVTDYTMFFMSEARWRLRRGEPRLSAARRAAMRIAPVVVAAGMLVAGAVFALRAGELDFFRVFGAGLALCALVITLVCVTLVPALLGLFGPRLFGRRVREGEPPPEARSTTAEGTSPSRMESVARERRRLRSSSVRGAYRASRRHAREERRAVLPLFGARLLAARPVALVVAAICVATLLVAAGAARSTDVGVLFVKSLPAGSEPRHAADDAARGFQPGIVSPSEVVLEQPGIGRRLPELARLQSLVARERGVALVVGPREQAAIRVARFAVARGDGAVRLAVVFSEDATGARGIADFRALRDRMPALLREAGLAPGVVVSFGGEAALASETLDAIGTDLRRIAVAASLVIFLLLALFLRALVAPLLLLFGSALAVAASFGLAALMLPASVGRSDFVYYVPLVAIVLLVALGSDYNVFITARIREEARRRRMREAIAVGAPAASRAITAAGITLAGTFALLALVPLRPFRELALLMAIGVLVDALLVRPLLIPTLIAVTGKRTWWPGEPARPVADNAFLQQVALRSGESMRDAARMTKATLHTLGERLPKSQAHELARHLPRSLAGPMADRDGDAMPFTCDEFVRRVARRAGTSAWTARDEARAVLATLSSALPDTEIEYLRAALSEDYGPLFEHSEPPAERLEMAKAR